jgi:hypothetical protein
MPPSSDRRILTCSPKFPPFDGWVDREEVDDEEEPSRKRQTIRILKERGGNDDGTTFFQRKATFGGLEPSDAKRLRTLEDENRRLKKLLAEQMLDNAALKDLVEKHLTPRARQSTGAVWTASSEAG